VITGVFLFWTAKHLISNQCQDTVLPPRIISGLEKKFDVNIKVLSSQKIKAFVYQKNIYVTMGLLERLDEEELKAVIAHEIYHLRHSPNKLLSSILALTSLTFKRHNDDYRADKYAAQSIGVHPLINAFHKLEIINSKERIRKLCT
jgi:Zn-dependent protease with chaperone function